MNQINQFIKAKIDVCTPDIIKTSKEINDIKSQLAATSKVTFVASYILGRLINFLSCGRLCASNVHSLKTRLVALENRKAQFARKASTVGKYVLFATLGASILLTGAYLVKTKSTVLSAKTRPTAGQWKGQRLNPIQTIQPISTNWKDEFTRRR